VASASVYAEAQNSYALPRWRAATRSGGVRPPRHESRNSPAGRPTRPAMTTLSSSRLVLVLLANLALSATACGGFGSGDPAGSGGASAGSADSPDGEGPKAPGVGGPADTSELTDAFGVFVSPSGRDDADGSRERPLASIQAAIDLGAKVGKRVYVCTGTYREALTLGDSISVIGGLDCSGGAAGWRTGAARTRVEAPTSPAVRASNIKTATRLEGLEILAPNAAAPGGSSIGLLADHASALVVASTKIVAGDAAKGEDGAEGVQLTQDPAADGKPQVPVAECVSGATCTFSPYGTWNKAAGALGGTNTCIGSPGIEAQPGGYAGSGGLWSPVYDGVGLRYVWQVYTGKPGVSYAPDLGDQSRTGAAGANGVDGPNAGAIGTFSADGYVAADGLAGAHGATGFGGAGGRGDKLLTDANAPYVKVDSVWRGYGGSGGGAGGCPGLAGTPGKGGGASIAVLLIESATRFDSSEILAGRGGDAGLGALGSEPTAGGNGGPNSAVGSMPLSSGKPGGRGGAAGTSGNGASGPSIGIAHLGAAPSVTGTTKITPGAGGNAIDERTRTDGLGITKTVAATPAGVSKEILAL
jgi:hypothetical protein